MIQNETNEKASSAPPEKSAKTSLEAIIARTVERTNEEIAKIKNYQAFLAERTPRALEAFAAAKNLLASISIEATGIRGAYMTGRDETVQDDSKLRVELYATLKRSIKSDKVAYKRAGEISERGKALGFSISVNACSLQNDVGKPALVTLWV